MGRQARKVAGSPPEDRASADKDSSSVHNKKARPCRAFAFQNLSKKSEIDEA